MAMVDTESRSVLQLIAVDKDEDNVPRFKLDEDVLKKVLTQDHVKDLPVVVYSIVGKYRDGKSFLMNMAEGFLRNKGEDNWINPENLLRGGFEWEPGSTRCTSGIWISSEPFVVEGPNCEKVAVVLMDTQGTFDTASSTKECSTIFALSTLISNLLICNLKEKFSRDDLEALQMFVEFGKAAQDQGNRPFKELKFLIRDWCADAKYPYGAGGGAACIQHQLQQQSGNHLQDIFDCFEAVGCFLMPVPWDNIHCRTEKTRSVTDLSGEFKNHVTDLLTSTLSWENLRLLVKTDLNGADVTAKDIVSYVTAYVDIFNSDDLSVPRSAFEANLEISLTKAKDMSLIVFDDVIARDLGSEEENRMSLPVDSLNDILSAAQQKAVDHFKKTVAGIKDVTSTEAHREKLEAEIRLRIFTLENENDEKKLREDQPLMIKKSETRIQGAARRLEDVERKGVEAEKKQKKIIRDLTKQKMIFEREMITQRERFFQEVKSSEEELERVTKTLEEKEAERARQEKLEEEEKELSRKKKKQEKFFFSCLLRARSVFVFGGVLSAGFFAYRLVFSRPPDGLRFMGVDKTAWGGLGGCLLSAVLSILISRYVRGRRASRQGSDSDSDSDYDSNSDSNSDSEEEQHED